MTKWLLITGFMIALGLGLGGCSASPFGGLATQANLAGDNDAMCQGAGSQAAYAQCMQQRSSGSAGYNEEEGHFAPGSQLKSLFQSGQ